MYPAAQLGSVSTGISCWSKVWRRLQEMSE